MTDIHLISASKLHQQRLGNLPRSIEKRAIVLRTFSRWMNSSMLEASREDVELFLDSRNIGANTRYGYLSHLHCFFAWAIEEGFTDKDPTARIIRPKMRRRLPRPAVSAELAQALEVASPRLKCWIVLAAFQGLRCQEIAGLRREDLLDADELLRVAQGKGAHERLLPLHPGVMEALNLLPLPRSGWVFTRPKGGKFTPHEMSMAFNLGLREVGVTGTAHQLRHWFGTHLYAQSNDLRLTQEMLGHASPATTAIYTQFNRKAAAIAVSALSMGA